MSMILMATWHKIVAPVPCNNGAGLPSYKVVLCPNQLFSERKKSSSLVSGGGAVGKNTCSALCALRDLAQDDYNGTMVTLKLNAYSATLYAGRSVKDVDDKIEIGDFLCILLYTADTSDIFDINICKYMEYLLMVKEIKKVVTTSVKLQCKYISVYSTSNYVYHMNDITLITCAISIYTNGQKLPMPASRVERHFTLFSSIFTLFTPRYTTGFLTLVAQRALLVSPNISAFNAFYLFTNYLLCAILKLMGKSHTIIKGAYDADTERA